MGFYATYNVLMLSVKIDFAYYLCIMYNVYCIFITLQIKRMRNKNVGKQEAHKTKLN